MSRPALVLLRWAILARDAISKMVSDTEMAWHKKPLSIFLLYVFIAVLWYWELYIPGPGKSVTVMAVAAAVMSFRGDMPGREKMAWICLLLGFLLLELTSIDTERNSNEVVRVYTRRQEHEQFAGIASDIERSIKTSQASFNTTIGTIDENIKTVTGGDSICYLLIIGYGDTPDVIDMVAVNRGHYPLRGVSARVVDLDKAEAIFKANGGKMSMTQLTQNDINLKIGDMAVGSSQITQRLVTDKNETKRNYNIFFSALNGFWDQSLKLRRVANKWTMQMTVSKMAIDKNSHTTEVPVCSQEYKDYPGPHSRPKHVPLCSAE